MLKGKCIIFKWKNIAKSFLLNKYPMLHRLLGFNVNDVANDQSLLLKRGLEAALKRNNVWYNVSYFFVLLRAKS